MGYSKGTAVVAMAGLCTAAAAQSLSVHLSFDVTDAAMGEIVTAMVTAEFMNQPAGSYLSSVNIDLIASSSDVYDVVDVAPVAWNNASLGLDGQGVASGSDVLDINASQFSFIPPIDSSNPILITTFTLQRVGTGSITYSAEVVDGAPYPFSVTGGAFGGSVPGYGIDVFTSDTLLGTPSPGVLGMLGAGGVLGGRRRR
ncbi:MAG: hypothetical protein AB8F26_11225 [Phycisphaerales bacterium]